MLQRSSFDFLSFSSLSSDMFVLVEQYTKLLSSGQSFIESSIKSGNSMKIPVNLVIFERFERIRWWRLGNSNLSVFWSMPITSSIISQLLISSLLSCTKFAADEDENRDFTDPHSSMTNFVKLQAKTCITVQFLSTERNHWHKNS